MGGEWLSGNVLGWEPAVNGARHLRSSPLRGPDHSQAEHSGHTNEAFGRPAEVLTGEGKS